MSDIYKNLGFKDENEFHRMVCDYRMDTPEDFARFKVWKAVDGSKEGLLYLLKNQDKDYA